MGQGTMRRCYRFLLFISLPDLGQCSPTTLTSIEPSVFSVAVYFKILPGILKGVFCSFPLEPAERCLQWRTFSGFPLKKIFMSSYNFTKLSKVLFLQNKRQPCYLLEVEAPSFGTLTLKPDPLWQVFYFGNKWGAMGFEKSLLSRSALFGNQV